MWLSADDHLHPEFLRFHVAVLKELSDVGSGI